MIELRLLRGVGTDQLRPKGLVAGRVMGLTLLDGTKDLVQGDARAATRRPRIFSSGAGSGKVGLLLGGERPAQGGDGNVAQGGMFVFPGQLRVNKRLDAGLELAQEEIDGEIKAGAARFDEEPVLDLETDLTVAAFFHDKVRLGVRAVAQDALETGRFHTLALDLRLEIAA